MSAMASQITSLTIVYSTVYSGTDQRKRQSSESLAFVRGIHRWPVNSPHTWPVTWEIFPFDDVIMNINELLCVAIWNVTAGKKISDGDWLYNIYYCNFVSDKANIIYSTRIPQHHHVHMHSSTIKTIYPCGIYVVLSGALNILNFLLDIGGKVLDQYS